MELAATQNVGQGLALIPTPLVSVSIADGAIKWEAVKTRPSR